jgi:hypothetical protein
MYFAVFFGGVNFSPLGNKKKSGATKDFVGKKKPKLPDFKDLFFYFLFLKLPYFNKWVQQVAKNISDFFNFSTFLSYL